MIVTSYDIYPEVRNGVRYKRVDLVTHYDENDCIIPHQVDSAIRNGKRFMKIIFADTNEFVLLSYHFFNSNWTDAEVYLEDFSASKGTISIKKTVLILINVVPSLPAVHLLTGCDSALGMCGIGKDKAISVAKKMHLVSVGQLTSCLDVLVLKGRIFTAKLFGMTDSLSSQNR